MSDQASQNIAAFLAERTRRGDASGHTLPDEILSLGKEDLELRHSDLAELLRAHEAQAAEIERLREALTFASVVVDQVAQCEDVEPNSLAAAIIYINDVLGDPIQPRALNKKEEE